MNNQSEDEPTDEPIDDPAGDHADQTPAAAEPAANGDVEAVIGVRIREASRIYHMTAPWGQVFVGDYVVINRGQGPQLARVVTVPDDPPTADAPRDVRPIMRLADADDRDRSASQARRGEQILEELRSTATRDGLGLYPIAVELNLSGDQGTAWFQAPEHVDFRALLREIETRHGVQLKMQQANQRERAMLVDGYDVCGLRLCCSSWMTDFPHVGIRVAKDQDLPLNPDSISGVCGRLLCCLTFEHEVYREMRGSLPRVGKRVSTPAGMGKVIKLNVLQQKVTIVLDDHPQRVDVPAAEIGLAVRTEDAPNEALLEADQARALRRAAAPARQPQADQPSSGDDDSSEDRPRRRRRRKRKPSASDAAAASPSAEEADNRRPSRRRRKSKVVNQQNQPSEPAAGEAVAPPSADAEQRRPRRRRRPRRAVNQPDQPPPASE